MSQNTYESFRTALTMNLCSSIQDPDVLRDVLAAVDVTMAGYEISRKHTDIVPVAGTPEVLKHYLAAKAIGNRSAGTVKQYRYKLSAFLEDVRKPYTDITPNDIRVYLYQFQTKHNAKDTYVENVRVTINSFFTWLVENDYLQKNPCLKVEKIKCQQRQREALTTLSVEALRWHCADAREKALVDFLYSTGCRVSECAGVLLDDIDWATNAVLIRNGKGGKQRTVYFNDEAKVSLREYLKTRQDDSPALWVRTTASHAQLHKRGLQCIISDIGKRAGIHVYPHKLRHTFATVGLRNGLSLDKLQALMGHASPRTTLIYAEQNNLQLRMEHTKAFS